METASASKLLSVLKLIQNFPTWLKALIVIAIIGYWFFNRWLKHREIPIKYEHESFAIREKEKTKRLKIRAEHDMSTKKRKKKNKGEKSPPDQSNNG